MPNKPIPPLRLENILIRYTLMKGAWKTLTKHDGERNTTDPVKEQNTKMDQTGREESDAEGQAGNPIQSIYTAANVITLARLALVPFFFSVLLTRENDALAFGIFVVAACTDWVDGQIARRTNTVSEFGKLLDPIVDRLLIASGVLGLYLIDRLPPWIVFILILRDVYLMFGFAYLETRGIKRLPVIFLGKLTTAVLLFAFAALILNWPLVPGLGLIEASFLPGWGQEPFILGIWLVYLGIVLSLTTAAIYTYQGAQKVLHPEKSTN